MWPFGENLAVLGKLQFCAFHRLADGADDVDALHRIVHCDDGGGLGHAVAFVDVEACGIEEPDDLGLYRRAAGYYEHLVTAEIVSPLAVDETVRCLPAASSFEYIISKTRGTAQNPSA